MQVVIENKQNLDFQPPQQQVVSNAELKQYRVGSINKRYRCNICDDRFLYPYELTNHIAKHTGNEKYECNIDKCKKKFFSAISFRKHKESHGVFSNYLCSICNKSLASSYSLEAHNISKKHLTMASLKHNRYTCDICPETFSSKRKKEYHCSISHPEYKPYPCSACNKRFVTLQVQKHHYKTIHNNKTQAKHIKKYKCDLCDKGYPKLKRLTRHHKKRHPNQNPYICNLCDKNFLNKSTKVHHQKTQHEELLKNHKITLASNDKQNFYQDKNKYQTLELANQSLPSISSVKDINNTNSNQYLGEITQLDMTSIEETINEDNNQYQLSKWPDDCQLDIFSEENFINENDISDINGDVNELKQMMDL